MLISRNYKLARKFTRMILLGMRPSCIRGRFTGPKVILNSIPKCGTNLAQEILLNFPVLHSPIRRTLLTQMGSARIMSSISAIRRGQFVPAHIMYDQLYEDALAKHVVKMIFVVRDFRDAILSHIHYIDKIDVSHSHHKLFAGLKSMDEKLQACLNGVPGTLRGWPDLVAGFRGWVKSDRVLVVRFEDLIDGGDEGVNRKREVICRMASFLEINDVDVDLVLSKMYDENGLTFNAPGIGKWKRGFTSAQIEKINTLLADDLRYFGYA